MDSLDAALVGHQTQGLPRGPADQLRALDQMNGISMIYDGVIYGYMGLYMGYQLYWVISYIYIIESIYIYGIYHDIKPYPPTGLYGMKYGIYIYIRVYIYIYVCIYLYIRIHMKTYEVSITGMDTRSKQ